MCSIRLLIGNLNVLQCLLKSFQSIVQSLSTKIFIFRTTILFRKKFNLYLEKKFLIGLVFRAKLLAKIKIVRTKLKHGNKCPFLI